MIWIWMVGGWDVRGMLIRESLACFFEVSRQCDEMRCMDISGGRERYLLDIKIGRGIE